jgi:D-glycero-D-manno-heptose 1,7-bisphosphate phosphatase
MDRKAVFLDRDGVLVRDVGPRTTFEEDLILSGVAVAVARLTAAGFLNVIVTNQTVIARGLLSRAAVDEIHDRLVRNLAAHGATIHAVYVCPHHPEATLPEYRQDCQCRKPASGMLIQAAADLGIDFSRSFLVGDRLSDIVAGHRVGVQTILVKTGRHQDEPIRSQHWPKTAPVPDFICASLLEAADHILAPG